MRSLGLKFLSVLMFGAAVAACTGPKGDPGQKGDPGPEGPVDPSVSAVTPTAAFLARTLDVSISGNGTAWGDKTTVDFGPNITVNKVTAGSATGLVANISVQTNAALGPRDVTVTDDSGKAQVFKGAFDIQSPLKVTTSGSLAVGSVITVRARGLDFETPFDTTSTGDGFFTPLTFTNITVNAPAGANASVDNVTDYVVDYSLFVDVLAQPATVDIALKSGVAPDQIAFPLPSAFAIAARSPKAVTPAAVGSDMIANPGDSALFSYTPANASLKIVTLTAEATDPDASPGAYFLPKSGKFADAFAAGGRTTQVWSSTDTVYAIAIDTSGYAGYPIGLRVEETPTQGGAEKEPNDAQADAETNGAVSLPYVVQGAKLLNTGDEDWYAVTFTAADMGKSLWALTSGLDRLTDTVLEIVDDQGNSVAGPSDDQGFLDELKSDPITKPGTYFVKVTPSPYFDPAHQGYDLILRLE
jgi:hypothetical protein